MRARSCKACKAWVFLAATLAFAITGSGCKRTPAWERGKKILHLALREQVASLDPVRTANQYDSMARAQVYEPLYTYEYLIRPFTLRPLLAARMPEISADRKVYTITLRPGVRFQDDPCFPGGHGREVVARDVIDSMMRMADRDNTPGGWWIYQDRIVGFDDFQRRMNARSPGQPFDWDAVIPGLRVTGRHELEIELLRPVPQMLYFLAMPYAAVVPRECAEHYGREFGSHPVGTGPFRLREWVRGSRLSYERNPTFRDERYPDDASPEIAARGLLARAGQKVPFVDGLVIQIYEQDQPMWLAFRAGDVDLVQVPAEYQPVVYDKDHVLRDRFRAEGMSSYALPLLDFVHRGFNMEDPLVGQGESARYLRQAISLAADMEEIDRAFYNSTAVIYDGPIPPGLDGHDASLRSPYRGPDLDRARELLARAGYPDGEGLPAIQYDTANETGVLEQAEMFARQVGKIGVRIAINPNSFPEFQQKLDHKKVQIFNWAWNADYPDAENFLQLFYGPNIATRTNSYNYENLTYDELYDAAVVLAPGPERTALYGRMRDLVIADVPAFTSMSRTRYYLWNRHLFNVLPAEVWASWIMYLDVER